MKFDVNDPEFIAWRKECDKELAQAHSDYERAVARAMQMRECASFVAAQKRLGNVTTEDVARAVAPHISASSTDAEIEQALSQLVITSWTFGSD